MQNNLNNAYGRIVIWTGDFFFNSAEYREVTEVTLAFLPSVNVKQKSSAEIDCWACPIFIYIEFISAVYEENLSIVQLYVYHVFYNAEM